MLVTAARALFGARGYAGVGTEEIVRAAGVTRGALYHQFRDKASLFAAVAEEVEAGRLRIVLRDSEHAPLPANLVTPHGRLSVPKVRSFVDFAVPRLRAYFEQARRITDAD